MTFAENEAYLQKALGSEASALLIPRTEVEVDRPHVQVDHVRVAFAKILALLHPEPKPIAGIHPSAVVDPTAQLDETVHVGPNCVIEKHAILGPGVVLTSQVYVGPRCSLGADLTIDCGALGATRIGKGSKIDNLVQIGHNVVIGEHSIVIAQSGIAGSSRIGRYVILAGQSGIAGHLSIGDKAVVAAQSGVMHSIPAGEKWMGSPAQPDRKAKRQLIAITQLPEWMKKLKAQFLKDKEL